MLKALIKKQFLELNITYFQDKKTGKRRSRGAMIGYIILMAVLFVVLAGMFVAIAFSLGSALIPTGNAWLYFSIMGLIAICLGTFGDVFNTYATLYQAKDNDLLLSMPIPPARILFVRMIAAYATGLLYEALVFVPSCIVYWIITESVTVLNVLFPILLTFVLGFFVLTLTCALGWVVALISARLKSKSFVTALLSLAFIALYYFVYFRINTLLQNVLLHLDQISSVMRSGLYPFYQMGLAADGNPLAMLIFTAMVAALFALTYYILSRSFIHIVTMKRSGKKAVYKERTAKSSGIRTALFRKELKRFTSSSTYLLNGGLGIIIMLAAAVAALIKADALREVIAKLYENAPSLDGIFPAILAALICLLASMNVISAPSVSLEGKTLWVVQAFPVDPMDALRAKLCLHILLNAVPAVIVVIVCGAVLGLPTVGVVLAVIMVLVFIVFSAQLGLILDLRRPNLNWTNEAVPIKQSSNVMIVLFGGWVVSIGFGFACYFLRNFISAEICLGGFAVVLAAVCALLQRWLKHKGAGIYAAL